MICCYLCCPKGDGEYDERGGRGARQKLVSGYKFNDKLIMLSTNLRILQLLTELLLSTAIGTVVAVAYNTVVDCSCFCCCMLLLLYKIHISNVIYSF